MLKKLTSSFFWLLFFNLIFHFTPQQVFAQNNKSSYATKRDSVLAAQAINYKELIEKELKARNLTEPEARSLAGQYGMSYDDFLKNYLNINQVAKTPPKNYVDTSAYTGDQRVNKRSVYKDTLINGKYYALLSKDSTDKPSSYFGYDIFKNIPRAFEPSENGPVDPGYIIGPGDVLRLYVWGAVEFQYELKVDAQGTVFVPTAGQIFVSGITYSDLQNKLTRYLSRYFSGLATNPPSVFLDVSMAKLRPLKIFVMGDVARPGGYNISSFATVFNTIYSIGGPLTTGSLRDIRVIRNNQVVTKVDLYDYLLRGRLIGDLRMQNNDVVFVPARKKTVIIKGQVVRPMAYELKDEEGINELIEFSGGLKASAYRGKIQVNRIKVGDNSAENISGREIVDIRFAELQAKKDNFLLQDGDTVTVLAINNQLLNAVEISGAVNRPGRYDINKAKDVKQLIGMASGLKPEAYSKKADLLRTRPDSTLQFISLNLDSALKNSSTHNIALTAGDKIVVYALTNLDIADSVSISGCIKNPITIPFADSLTLYDMLFKAGGLTDPEFKSKVLMSRGDIIRRNSDGITTRIISFNLDDVLAGKQNIPLAKHDKVIVYKADVAKRLERTVTIEGEVRSPGVYTLSDNMTPLDLILQAGGFTEEALQTRVSVSRPQQNVKDDKLSDIYNVDLDPESISKNIKPKFTLDDRDIVSVYKNPDLEEKRIVTLRGEVLFPGKYILSSKNEKLSQLIAKAGGPTKEAYFYSAIFIRDKKRLSVDLEKLLLKKRKDEDVVLKNGDEIFIFPEPNTVEVKGEVNYPSLHKYVKGQRVGDYIKIAGGRTENGRHAIYTRANGQTLLVKKGIFRRDPIVKDGSTIEVLPKPPVKEKKNDFDLNKTLAGVLTIVSTTLTILLLSKQLK